MGFYKYCLLAAVGAILLVSIAAMRDEKAEERRVMKEFFDQGVHGLRLRAQYDQWKNGKVVRDLTPNQWKYVDGVSKRAQAQKKRQVNMPRKDLRRYTEQEWSDLTKAWEGMRANKIDGMNEFDILVGIHKFHLAPAAHFGAAFLGWHREYNARLEAGLRKYVPGISLPYWDMTLDQLLPVPMESSIWTPELLGNNHGPVTSGLPANWESTVENCEGVLPRNMITMDGAAVHTRAGMPTDPHKMLYNDTGLDYLRSKSTYGDVASYVGNPPGKLEHDHAGPHWYVGGAMSDIECTPADPTFWMLHTFVDCNWQWWRLEFQTTDLETDYPTSADGFIGGAIHEPDAVMVPFTELVNIDGNSKEYDLVCAERTRYCESHEDCDSEHIWCNKDHVHNNDRPEAQGKGRCYAKIVVGGDCTGFGDIEDADPCYKGECEELDAPEGQTTHRCVADDKKRNKNQELKELLRSLKDLL